MNKETSRTETTIFDLDTGKFAAFADFAAENPERVIFQLEASATTEGRTLHSFATTGPYTLGGERIDRLARRYSYHFGAHREVEAALGFADPTDREQETEVALAALSGCINAAVTASAAVRGIDLAKLKTDVSVTWNPAVFLGLESAEEDGVAVNQFDQLEITLHVDGDLDDEDVAFIRKAVQRSAVLNLISLPHVAKIAVRKE